MSKNILVVDDDKQIHELINMILSTEGHTVIARNDGFATLKNFMQISTTWSF